MAITTAPLEYDDVPTFVRTELAAFKDHPRTPMSWRLGYTDEVYAFSEARLRESFEDPNTQLFKALDGETGQIIAVSKWTFALQPEKNKKIGVPAEDEEPPADIPAGFNWPLRCFWKRNFAMLEKEFLEGKPYILLDNLTANPAFHGKGAGAALLKWGLEQADTKGVMLCLESTPAGLKLYERYGFRQAKIVKADMRDFGWTEPYDEEACRRVFMLREPKTA